MTEVEELRNQRDYRLHVLCEAKTLIELLPQNSRRDAVLEAIWRMIKADLNATAEMLYEYRTALNKSHP